MSDEEIDSYVHDLQQASVLVAIPAISVVADDPDDDPIVATAVVAQVSVLCTRDRDLHRQNVIEYCAARAASKL
jgi:predicted nucleic acid-binding protein